MRWSALPRALVLIQLAQSATLTAQPGPPKGLCFQSAPRPRCSAFLLTEFGAGVRLAADQNDSRATLFEWNLGAIKNVNPRIGIGGSGFFTWSEGFVTVGIQPRLRYWATPRLSIDLAPGLVILQGGARTLGFNGVLATNLGPSVALTTTVQTTDAGVFQGNRRLNRTEWFVGARLGGKVGSVTGLAGPLLTFLAYVILYNRIDN